MSGINYSEKIPNNVNLSKTARCSARSSSGSPTSCWWDDMGPEGSTNFDVYLRTA
jgi:benzoyl-CoA 2,3-epoxidase subunit B